MLICGARLARGAAVAGRLNPIRHRISGCARAPFSVGASDITGRIVAREGCIFIENAAKRNAMTLGMYRDVPRAVSVHLNGNPRVCILAGAGQDAFGAGSDITEFPEHRMGADAAARYSEIEDAASEALLSIPHPVLARIHGPCFGGALNLALAADLRYCADDATFCVPPAKLGIGYPRSLMDLLVAAVGTGNAKDLLFTARVVDAQEAMRMGLVNAVLPKAELNSYCDQIAKSIAESLAPMTIAAAKMELAARAHPAGSDARRVAEIEADRAYAGVYDSDDYKEGVHSFLERRRPIWRGK